DDGEVLAIFGEEYSRTLRDPRLTALNGRFHGLLLDRARRTATIFNDRYGLQRLYVHESKDAFYFAAEAKAILTVRPSCGASIRAQSANSSPAGVCSRIGRCSTGFVFCRPPPPGYSVKGRSSARASTSILESGSSSRRSTASRTTCSCVMRSARACRATSTDT